jgi:hypothetical protein
VERQYGSGGETGYPERAKAGEDIPYQGGPAEFRQAAEGIPGTAGRLKPLKVEDRAEQTDYVVGRSKDGKWARLK